MKTCNFTRAVSIFTALLLTCSFITGCSHKNNTSNPNTTSSDITTSTNITTEQIIESITESIQHQNEMNLNAVNISYNWEDYVGNVDALVYGFIINEFELLYNVFDAALELPDGSCIYGIGYTDFAEYYEADDGTGFFPAGFISLIGEPSIPEQGIENGLIIHDLEYDRSDYSFVYAYDTSEHMEHCVIWDKYIKYGINDKSQITYQVEPYIRGECDESLGALYSYDDERYVFDPDVGNYFPLTGISLNEKIDYTAIEKEINEILEQQDSNLAKVDIETSVYFVHEALNSYLLSMQEETFLGYKVSELIAISNDLNPMECVRITPDGILKVDIQNDIPQTPDALTKWLVGISCGIVVAACIAVDVFVPALLPLSGAISGAAIDVFCQVVIENQTLSDVNWNKVAVSSVSGALLAWACPLLSASVSKGVVNILGEKVTTEAIAKLAGYATLTFSNALISGSTNAAFSIIDGKEPTEVFNSFIVGAAIGGCCTAATSALTEITAKLSPKIAEIAEKVIPNKWLSKIKNSSKSVATFIQDHQITLKNEALEDILAPKSVYQATKSALEELKRVKEFKMLNWPSDTNTNFLKVDSNGNPLTKSDLLENGGDCIIKLTENCDEQLKASFKKYGVTELVMKDGVIDQSPISVFEFNPINGVTDNRESNMKNYYNQLVTEWTETPSLIPEQIRPYLKNEDIPKISASKIKNLLSAANLTPHEETDFKVYLVDSYIHSKLSHYGGVALAKAHAMMETASTSLEQLLKANVYTITGTLIPKGII